jgi:hypothetical protein
MFITCTSGFWNKEPVKNSIRYEEAKHVAMALKTMIYSARLFSQFPEEQKVAVRSLT